MIAHGEIKTHETGDLSTGRIDRDEGRDRFPIRSLLLTVHPILIALPRGVNEPLSLSRVERLRKGHPARPKHSFELIKQILSREYIISPFAFRVPAKSKT